jgi:hypothetical protein
VAEYPEVLRTTQSWEVISCGKPRACGGRLELITLDSTDQPFPLCPLLASARAALAELDEGTFAEGHELDRKWRVPKEMIGRRLSQEEAKEVVG